MSDSEKDVVPLMRQWVAKQDPRVCPSYADDVSSLNLLINRPCGVHVATWPKPCANVSTTMLGQTLGLHHGYQTTADLDIAIDRTRERLKRGSREENLLMELSTALRYRFLRVGELQDFQDAVGIVSALPRPTFEDIGTANAVVSAELLPEERHWRRLQPWLEAQGYMLRSRFHADWVPSWLVANVSPVRASDHYPAKSAWVDATRIEDNASVWLKLTPENTTELDISAFFISGPRRFDPRNHCCPLLDFLRPPLIEGKKQWLLIMPLLRGTLEPPPATVKELASAVLDLAEGLLFMHENNVAHRDICLNNTMMDGTDLIPGGWSAFAPNYRFGPNGMVSHAIRVKSRSSTPVKYYFIDFGLSSRFTSFSDRKLVVGDVAQNLTVPELSKRVPYDPFALDVRMFGDMIRALQMEFAGLEFLDPLVDKLVSDTPSERVNAQQLLEFLRAILTRRSKYLLLLPLRPRERSSIWAWMRYPLRLFTSVWQSDGF
ncbi:hypothetical protein AURDEDRAFT_124948 [Auricularia subglabra TFB-10046 SS5]|nr:hypothetical protein AURDEDRAFT_124948 [Auricularia subglabra TFB-10046 SS5]